MFFPYSVPELDRTLLALGVHHGEARHEPVNYTIPVGSTAVSAQDFGGEREGKGGEPSIFSTSGNVWREY